VLDYGGKKERNNVITRERIIVEVKKAAEDIINQEN
jgi:hypothetical protein